MPIVKSGVNLKKEKNKMSKSKYERIIAVYEKCLNKIWDDLSDDDRVRLEGHFSEIINWTEEIKEEK